MPNKQRLNPVSLKRSIAADRWLKRYQRALLVIFNTWTRQAAERVRHGETLVTDAMVADWQAEFARENRRWILNMVAAGYEFSQLEFGDAKIDALPDITSVVIREPAAVVQEADVSFLLRGDFTTIDTWVTSTSVAVTETQRERLVELFEEAILEVSGERGYEKGVPPRVLAKRLEQAGVADNKVRARMLARTGTIWAYNQGALQNYKRMGVGAMEWQVTADDLTCDYCLSMDGAVVSTSGSFFSTGDKMTISAGTMRFPFGVEHPPLHPNCLVGETFVLCPGNRHVQIRDMRVGDRVVIPGGEANVEAVLSREYTGCMITIYHATGALACTEDHSISVAGGWTKAGDIRAGHMLNGLDGYLCKVLIVESCQREVRVWNLTIKGDAPVFFANGILVHNCRCVLIPVIDAPSVSSVSDATLVKPPKPKRKRPKERKRKPPKKRPPKPVVPPIPRVPPKPVVPPRPAEPVAPAKPPLTRADSVSAAEKRARAHGVNANYNTKNLDLANAMNKTLDEVERAGFKLPKKVHIDSDLFKHLRNRRQNPASYLFRADDLAVNPAADFWRNAVIDARAHHASGFWSTASTRAPLRHEIGHALHKANIGVERFAKEFRLPLSKAQKTRVAKGVSRYGASSRGEFVGEVFSGLIDGRTYSDEIMSLYKAFGGAVLP